MKKLNNGSIINALSVSLTIVFVLAIAVLAIWRPAGLRNIFGSKNSQLAAVVAANLSTSANFAVLAGASVVDANISTVVGDVGLSPASGSFNHLPCVEVTGTIYAVDGAGPLCYTNNPGLLTQAKADLTTAYNFTANETPATTLSGSDNQLGGKTLTAGIYTFSAATSANITGTVTLDGQGDPNAVFVFQTNSTLVTASNAVVSLVNGAQACNVFWQVGSSATLGTGTQFVGTIMADQSITDAGGSTVIGRLLASVASVTLNNTHVTVPTCTTSTASSLRVIKSVINLSTGTAVPSDFMIHVKSATSTLDVSGSPAVGVLTPGTLYTLPTGTYTISENPNNYTQTFGGDCVGGSVTFTAPGQSKVCTVINTDISIPTPTASYGGDYTAPLPLIALTKIPSPLALPGGPGPVTYTYTLKNIGYTAVSSVWVKDNKCSPVKFISGDTNGDSKLDTNESWIYSCTKTVSQTETNMATAHGWTNGWDGYATAVATVAVGTPKVPPIINITKVPNQLIPFQFGGGDVTYTYTVTNPGVVPMSGITVTDDKCPQVSYISGDINANNLLDHTESWVYSCKTHISVSTMNVATAIGQADGFIATGYALATVIVSPPKLPNTGFSPFIDTWSPLFWKINLPMFTVGSQPAQTVAPVAPAEQTVSNVPTRIKIPKINVDASVESVGLTQKGEMGVPAGPDDVAWFELGPRPGEVGSAVVSGHSGWKNGISAVFDNLRELQKGDKIYVDDGGGKTVAFVVSGIRTYGKNQNASDVFTSNDNKVHLNLITCSGVWDESTKSSSDRLVVFAEMQ